MLFNAFSIKAIWSKVQINIRKSKLNESNVYIALSSMRDEGDPRKVLIGNLQQVVLSIMKINSISKPIVEHSIILFRILSKIVQVRGVFCQDKYSFSNARTIQYLSIVVILKAKLLELCMCMRSLSPL